jgi:Tfp pilus assembly protein PilO
MEENKKSNYKIIVIVLALLLIGALGYTYYISDEHEKLTDEIQEEKLEIEQNLDSMIVRYENAIGQNTSMSNELAFERDRIMVLRDSIRDLKSTNYSLIRRYRREIANLEKTNRRLFFVTDSLTNLNEILNVDLDSAMVKISKQLAINDTLSMENIDLSEKVAIGSILKVSTGKIIAMRERSNGKLTETSRARNTDAFRINFVIANNEISQEGERQVFIQLMDSKGNVIAAKGEVEMVDATFTYSDKTTVNYMKEELEVISLIEVDRKSIERGTYVANIHIGNSFAKGIRIVLK